MCDKKIPPICEQSPKAPYLIGLRECLKIAQKKYERRHDWIRRHIYWEICGVIGIHVKPKWCEHQPEAVIENDSCKILWDITGRRPDMIVIDQELH